MKESLQARSVGELISQAFTLAFRNFGRLFLIQLLFGVILLILCIPLSLMVITVITSGGNEIVAGVVALPFVIAFLVLSPLPGAASIIAIADNFTDHHHSVLDCYRAVFPMLLKLLVLGFVVGILVFFGLILCIVPGILLLLMYAVSTQAMVCEDLKTGDALKRSSSLTTGHKGRLFGLFLCIFVINFLINQAAELMNTMLFPVSQLDPVMSPGYILLMSVPAMVLPVIASVVTGMFQTCAMVAAYFDLRVRKDSFHLEQLADIVDRIAPTSNQS